MVALPFPKVPGPLQPPVEMHHVEGVSKPSSAGDSQDVQSWGGKGGQEGDRRTQSPWQGHRGLCPWRTAGRMQTQALWGVPATCGAVNRSIGFAWVGQAKRRTPQSLSPEHCVTVCKRTEAASPHRAPRPRPGLPPLPGLEILTRRRFICSDDACDVPFGENKRCCAGKELGGHQRKWISQQPSLCFSVLMSFCKVLYRNDI